MFRTVPITVTLLALSACGLSPSGPEVQVDDAMITLPAIPGRPGAAYFTLRTNTDRTRLTGIRSPRIGRIELHETVSVGGFSRMIPMSEAAFNTDKPMRFETGGRHAMLFDLDPALRPGDKVSLTFSFDPAPPVTVEAEVRAAGDVAHGGH